ncbi:MAG: efflux RND transporter permease subunit [Xanthomonadaceae bacterium]|nr:efflux RND transporter permease subunit [Xanthomonadaceae bacterium]MDP2186903.1 efflux RND transporter permease subunit [Xanthomonadales bacterium]MDZ4115902.1 efflux RND transporter permease subunit [Xanthomonadaceae bacterium]MDZ4377829.1 efflux RND transporter permease subunit [Xanthomonadaceae bacterium]
MKSGWSLAQLSLKRPVTATMFFVTMVLIGLISATRLPLEENPDIQAPFAFISLPYPGSTPEEVERTITRPAEEALATLSGIKRMNSTSRADGASVFIEFAWSRDIEIAASEARERIDAIRDELPSDLQRYFVFKFATSDQPVLRIRFAGEQDVTKSYTLLDHQVKRPIERLSGVARVDISGVSPPEVEIAISNDRLSAHGLSLNELASRLQAANFSISAGEIDDGDRRIRVQPVGELQSLDQIRNLVIASGGVRLSDVADVHLKPSRVDYGRRLDGKPAVGIDIFKERNANLVEVVDSIASQLAVIAATPEFKDVQFITISDQAKGVISSLSELGKAGLIGSLLSIAILFFFLRHWPSTLMVSLAIPLCFVMTLGAMYFYGLTLNIMSMMGLLIGVGMLVDNAVVVTESIYQYREKYPDDPVRCAIEGTRGVQLAVSAGTLTSIIVFIPNLFGERNFVSLYLSNVALTITVAMLASWLVAVSLIPMISARIKAPKRGFAANGLIRNVQDRYANVLRWSLAHRGLSVLAIGLIVAVSIIPASGTKFDMFPQQEGREFELFYKWKGAYPLEQLSSEVRKIETYLEANRAEFQIKQIYSWYSEQGWAATRITLFDDPDQVGGVAMRPAQEVIEEIRKGMPRLATAEVGFDGNGNGGGGAGEGLQVSLIGDSAQTLKELADVVVANLAKLPELRDVRTDTGDESTELAVSVDRERAALYGFSAQDVANYVGIAIRGAPLREFRSGDTEVPMWIRFANAQTQSIDDLRSFNLRRPDGEMIPLMSVINVRMQRGATQIQRNNRQTALDIQADLAKGKTTPEARKAMENALKSMRFPPGYSWSFGGRFNDSDDAGQVMVFNTLLALVMIIVVMAALFESLLFPFAIISGVVFSALGVFWLFWLTGTTFSIMASIGILVLMGVVVNNGIVMIEHINNLRREGMTRADALVAGSRERLRPILMTMGTTVLGMLPLCLEGPQLGGDGPPYYPMARAIVGGLVFSTVVSLLFLPTIYAFFDDMSIRTSALVARARRAAPWAPRAETPTS